MNYILYSNQIEFRVNSCGGQYDHLNIITYITSAASLVFLQRGLRLQNRVASSKSPVSYFSQGVWKRQSQTAAAFEGKGANLGHRVKGQSGQGAAATKSFGINLDDLA